MPPALQYVNQPGMDGGAQPPAYGGAVAASGGLGDSLLPQTVDVS